MAGQSRASVYVYDLDTPSKARLVVNNVSLSGPVAITVPDSWYDAHGQVNVVAWAKVGNKMSPWTTTVYRNQTARVSTLSSADGWGKAGDPVAATTSANNAHRVVSVRPTCNQDYVRAVENYGDVFFNPNNAPPHTGGCMSTGTYAQVAPGTGWSLARGKGYHYTTSFGAFGFVGGTSTGFTSTVTIVYTNRAPIATYVCGPLNHLDPRTAPILYNRPT